MASSVDSSKIGSTQKIVGETFTGTAGAITGTYQDMRDYEAVGALATVAVNAASGAMTKLEILAADDSSGTNATVIKDSGTIAADAVDDQAFEECTAQEIAQLSEANGYSLRYVAARVTNTDTGDVVVVTLNLCGASYAKDNLTPDTTIA